MHQLSGFIPLILFVGLTAQCQAQFNDSTPYFVKVNSQGFANNTNEQKAFVLNNSMGFTVNRKAVSMNANASWVYGEQNKTKVNQDYSASFDANFFRNNKGWYLWSLAAYEKSLSLQIHDRFQIGGGPGYLVFDTKSLTLIVSDGLLYERNALYDREVYQTIRNSLRIKFRIALRDRLVIEGTDFIQHSLARANDYIILSHTSVSLKLNKWFSLSSSLTYNRMNVNGRENLQFNYGFVFERYF